MSRFQSWRAALCLACLTAPMLIGCGKKEVPQQAAPAPKEAVALPAPFGLHTDDLDEMLKRRNIRALVMIDPIDFFYSNGQPMGIAYEGMREFESFINQKMKTRALKVEVTFVPVRPDQLEAALTQGVGDLIAFASSSFGPLQGIVLPALMRMRSIFSLSVDPRIGSANH